MNKRILGIKISTYLAVLGSVALAIVVWVIVKMIPTLDAQAVLSIF